MTYAIDMPSVESAIRTDAGLASQLRVSVARLARRLRSERDPDNELSVGQLGVLSHLMREGESTVGQLAARERVQPPSMTRTVNALEQQGYVERAPSAEDGRCVLIRISERGEETLLADRRRRDAFLARALGELDEVERDLLRRVAPLLERLADR